MLEAFNAAEQEIFDRVQNLVVLHLGIDKNLVTPNSNYIGDLGADSLDVVELSMAYEAEFAESGVEFPDDVVQSMPTVRHAVKHIAAHLA